MPVGQRLELMLPGLEGRDYAVTSDQDERYNCIVWALGDDGRRWDPFDELGAYWLADVLRDDALRTVQLMFERLGFAICDGDAVEAEFEKIALYGSTRCSRTSPDSCRMAAGPANWARMLTLSTIFKI